MPSPRPVMAGILVLLFWSQSGDPSAIAASAAQSNEAPPVELVGQLGGFVTTMASHGSYAYVAAGPRLAVLDLRARPAPRLVGESEILDVHGPFHFLAAGGGLLIGSVIGDPIQVFDISEPSRPTRLGTLPVAGGGPIAVSDRTLFVADHDEVLAFDLRDPASPELLGKTPTHTFIERLVLEDDRLYVDGGRGLGMGVFDVADPTTLRLLWWLEDSDVRGIAIDDGLLFITLIDAESSRQWIQIHDAANGDDYLELGRIELDRADGSAPHLPGVDDIAAENRTLYVSAQSRALVIDASDPSAPVETTRFPIEPNTNSGANRKHFFGNPGRLLVRDRHLYLTYNAQLPGHPLSATSGVAVYDLSDPASPGEVEAWTRPLPHTVSNLALVDGKLIVGDVPSYFLRVYDITMPAAPRLLSTIEIDTRLHDIASDGSRMVVLDGSYVLHLIDLTDASAPRLVARHELWRSNAVALRGDLVYACFEGRGETGPSVRQLAILEITADEELVERHRFEGLPCSENGLDFVGETLVARHISEGLTFVDVRDPDLPSVVGSIDTPHYAMGMQVIGTDVYLSVKLPTPEDQRDVKPLPIFGGIMRVDASIPQHPVATALEGIHLDDYRGNARPWGVAVTQDIALLTAAEGYVRAFDLRDPSALGVLPALRVPGVVGQAVATGNHVYAAGHDTGVLILRVDGLRGGGGSPPIYLPAALSGR